jgi:hypothetical protein
LFFPRIINSINGGLKLKQLIFSDYGAKPELDRYESEGIDDEGEHNEIDYEARRNAERELNA